MSAFFNAFEDGPFGLSVAVLRGYNTSESLALTELIADAGVGLVEVSIVESDDLDVLAAVAEGAGKRIRVGAGTICSEAELVRAVAAGATFIVSPGYLPQVTRAARAHELPALPGVLTPTDVATARNEGTRAMKLFPASTLGPRHLAALRGPFPDVSLIPFGGVTLEDAGAYLAAGAAGIGLGSSILPPSPLSPLDLKEARKHLEQLRLLIQERTTIERSSKC